MASVKRTVIGMQAATLAEGSLCGVVNDLQFDLETRSVFGYRLKVGGVFGKQAGVATSAVRLLGKDLLFVEAEASLELATKSSGQEDGRAWASNYLGVKVMTRRGDAVGVVEDIEVARDRLVGLVLDQDRLVTLDGRVTLGRDAVVLEDLSCIEKVSEPAGFWGKLREGLGVKS